MSRKRKWMMGLLALGVGALVMDRTLLGPPEQASASEAALTGGESGAAPVEAEVSAVAAAGQGASPIADAPADLSAFARRLSALPEHQGEAFARGDGFDLPADWAPAQLPVPEFETVEEPVEQTPLASVFQANHTLDTTMITNAVKEADAAPRSEGGGVVVLNGAPVGQGSVIESIRVAVVDGQPYRVGDELDGFVLMQVASRFALWQSTATGEMVVLSVESPR